MSYREIIGRCSTGIDKGTLVNLERINSNSYSCKIDFALFCGSLSLNSYFDEGRLQRIISRIPQIEKENIVTALSLLYHSCNIQTKIDILKFVKQESGLVTNGFTDFFEKTYANNKKDIVYYGVIAESANGKFEIMMRADNV